MTPPPAGLLSIETLTADATVPDRAWMDGYWATRPGRYTEPPLPWVIVKTWAGGSPFVVTAYRDTADGWLWTLHHERSPLHTGANWQPSSAAELAGTLVRHPLTPERHIWFTFQILAVMPEAGTYPTTFEAAELFRAAGWGPGNVARFTRAGYILDDPADAAVIAGRPDAWWSDRGWPLPAAPNPRNVLPLTGRDVATLMEAGMSGETVDRLAAGGIHTAEGMLAARPPRVPAGVTRVRMADAAGTRRYGHTLFALTTDAARAFLDAHPAYWGPATSITWDAGPTVVHARLSDAGLGRWVLWSDGLLEHGGLVTPPELTSPEHRRTWLDSHGGAPGLVELLDRMVHADNFDDLPREVFAGLAAGATAAEVSTTRLLDVSRPVVHTTLAADLRRTVDFTTWEVTVPGGPGRLVYAVEDVSHATGAHTDVPGACARWVTDIAGNAGRVAEAWAADTRAGWTLNEAADQLGMTVAALRQAQHRAARSHRSPAEDVTPAGTTPRLYRLRDFQAMLGARPGPGRPPSSP